MALFGRYYAAIEIQLRENWDENHVRHEVFYSDNTLFTGDEIGG